MQPVEQRPTDGSISEHGATGGSVIDFLSLRFPTNKGLDRSGDKLDIHRPWARLHISGASLRPGWWMLECEVEGDPGTVEVQLSCPSDPLIVLSGQNAGAEHIYLQGTQRYEIILLISPWPGSVRAKRLRLRRLSQFETLQRIGAAATRVLRNPDRVELLNRISKRLLAGQALGMRIASVPSPVSGPLATPAAVQPTTSTSEHAESWAGVRVILGEGYRMDPRARGIVEDAFAASPGMMACYSDVREGGSIIVRRPWDAELARWHDLAGLPVFVRDELWRAGEPAWSQLQAIAANAPGAIGHIPLPLAERPPQASLHLTPPQQPALTDPPRVSVVLPTKVRIDLLKRCLAGLSGATRYPDLEVVVVDNGSDQRVLQHVLADARRSLKITTVVDNGDFNFSRLVNVGAQAATGAIILILNDDVEPIEAGWLHRIVESVLSTDVGAVGARLVYPDRTVQHAGVTLGIGGVCGHLYKGLSGEEASRTADIVYPGSRMAVTGACLAVRRDVFEAAQGFDQQFPVALNDIDFCLRLIAKGYRNIYRGDAVLIHHESQSRGTDDISAASRRRLARDTGRFLVRWKSLVENDPFSSPAFDPQIERGVAHRALRG